MYKAGQLTDGELIEAIKDKEKIDDAIRFLYAEHFESLSSLIKYNSGSAEDAQDIIQEVVVSFIQIVQNGKFRGESSVKTFLFALCRNTWLNELKKRGRMDKRNKIFETGKDEMESSISESVEEREIKKQLLETLNKLGESCKKILTLFYYDNLSMKEILAQTEYENEQVVRNRKHKCLKQLSELITENSYIAETLKQKFS